MRKHVEFKPDKLDRLIIRELEVDARQSWATLGAKLGVSPTTVQRRIKELERAKALVFVTMVDPRALGYKTHVLIGIKVQFGKADATMDALGSCRNIQALIATTGRYDIVLSAFFRDNGEIVGFVDRELGRLGHIANHETFVILHRVKDFWRNLNGDPQSTNGVQIHAPDDLDLKLMKELEMQPKRSITDLSRRLGACRRTVQSRLETLQTESVVSTHTVANQRIFGLYVTALIFVKVQSGKISDLTSVLAHDQRIPHIGVVSGRFDVFLWARFRDSDEMSEFVRKNLGDIPGVIKYEVFVQLGRPQLPLTSILESAF
jgi:Lrp/AsnC family transcriptional regulator, regulator for asnA, asnC and gidA